MNKPSINQSAPQTLEDMIQEHYGDCDPIAVIGYACRLADAPDSEAFWDLMFAGEKKTTPPCKPEEAISGERRAAMQAPNYVELHGCIKDVDAFDAAFFGYSPQEAELIDPQQRLFLETVWHAIEHGGYAPREVSFRTGIYGATRVSTYPGQRRIDPAEAGQVKSLQSLMGNDKDYLATRVAYKLNLSGPVLTVQTACSSSLVAVHLACESLRAGECDMAVAGGVAISFPQPGGYLHQPGMIFSPDGKCRPFDMDANGTFPGHGVASVTLRRLSDALRDGDPVIAVIRGNAVNNDGASKAGFTAPSVSGQKRVIREAMAVAGLSPNEIGLIEAHGTATPLGDPIEVQALREVFDARQDGSRCALGSVKGDLGHLDTAAGIVSFLKAVMCVARGVIPRCAHFKHPNPALRLDESPFHIPTAGLPWSSTPRHAGVSSFGIGGTNCHVIIGSLPDKLRHVTPQHQKGAPPGVSPARQPVLLLSAASEPALRRLAGRYAEALERENPQDLAHTALMARQLDLRHRLALRLDDGSRTLLRAFSEGVHPVGLHYDGTARGKIAFLCTGQGAHWPAMARSYIEVSPDFAAMLARCIAACDAVLPVSLREVLLGDAGALLSEMRYAQPAIIAFEIAMAALWRARGLRPDIVIGHSVGEYASAVIAGMLDLEAVMPLLCLRGALMDAAQKGGMISLHMGEDAARDWAERFGLDIAAINGAAQIVLSGSVDAIEKLASALEQDGTPFNHLPVAGAAHSRLMDTISDRFDVEAGKLKARDGEVRLISTCHGDFASGDDLNRPGFWGQHLRTPVRFKDGIDKAIQAGADIFLEIGPDAILTRIAQSDHPTSHRWIASAQRHIPAAEKLEEAQCALFTAAIDLDWRQIFAISGRRIHAPLYAFDRSRHWRDERDMAQDMQAEHPRLRVGLDHGRHTALTQAAMLNLPRLEKLYDCARTLHAIYLDRLILCCIGAWREDGVTLSEILRGGRLLPRYRQLLGRMVEACVEDGYYVRIGERYRPARPDIIPHASCPELLDKLASCCEGLHAIPATVERAGAQLFDMLRGQVAPVEIIFPEGESRGVEVLYQEFSFGRYFNEIAAGILAGMLREESARHKPFRILEVGGGTGGTTSAMVTAISAADQVLYHFTDISPVFTRRAAEKFAAYPFMRYDLLDLQKEPEKQGFTCGTYDLIIAANVVHATDHVGHTLTRLRSLLKPGGHLLLREITQPMRLFDFVFGPLVSPLLDLEERAGQLFLTKALWRKHCRAAGFARIDWLPDDGTQTAEMGEHIILATCPIAALPDLPAPAENQHPVLGTPLTSDGFYLADWSKCNADPSLWNQYLIEAARTLKRLHGGEENEPEIIRYPTPSHPVGRVRLAWCATPFGRGRLSLEAEDPYGAWHVIHPGHEAADLPAPTPSLSTQYEVGWEDMTPRAEIFPNADADIPSLTALMAQGEGTVDFQSRMTLHLLRVGKTDPLALLQTVRHHLTEKAATPLVIITRNGWPHGQDAPLQPTHRAVWGLIKVAVQEYPQQKIAIIDLDHASEAADLLSGLRGVEAGARFVMVRDGIARRQCIVPLTANAQPLPLSAFDMPGWHVVTGGFGGLGRLTIAWLAAHHAAQIAILAPRAPEDWRDFAEKMRMAHGVTLRWLPCDVADHRQLTDALEELAAAGGVAGVIHAAGLIEDSLFQLVDKAAFKRVWAVKAEASDALQSWLATHGGRYLLLYSSAAAVMGTAGQAAHASACGFLDGLAAAHRNDTALKVMSIAWGAWRGHGRADDDGLQSSLAAQGMGLITPGEGLWHLEQSVMRCRRNRLAMRLIPDALNAIHRDLVNAAAPGLPTSEPDKQDDARSHFETEDEAGNWLAQMIATLLRLPDIEAIDRNKTLIALGVDSLLLLELRSLIEKRSTRRLDARMIDTGKTINAIAQTLFASSHAALSTPAAIHLQHDRENRFSPFPLTPIQHAYWVGRTELIAYGGIACHILFEWDLDRRQIDPDRFTAAWNALIKRHDMLRMIIAPDGQQHILASVPHYNPARRDLTGLTPAQREEDLLKFRETLSSRVLPTDRWPLFDIAISTCDAHCYRLHLHLDLLLFDVRSLKIMMDDLAAAYRGETLPALSITFRDYVMAEAARRESAAWQTDWLYWCDRLYDLPPSPALPLNTLSPPARPRLETRTGRIEAQDWQRLKARWRSWGVTPSVGLLTLFARTLEIWARQPEFTLNLTMFDRQAVHEEIDQVIGDFTSVLLIAFDLREKRDLRGDMLRAQETLQAALQHKEVNGVELLRELARIQGHSHAPQMPIVFTSMLGMTLDGLRIDQAMQSFLGDPTHVFTQTPQVWLDHQVMEIEGALIFNWYCMDDVLAENFCADAFETYTHLLRGLAEKPELMEETILTARHPDGHKYDPVARWRSREDTATRLCRALESDLRSLPGIARAQADLFNPDHYVIDVVTDDIDAVPEAPFHPASTPPATLLPALPKDLCDEVSQAWALIEKHALAALMHTLRHAGLFTQASQTHIVTDIRKALNVIPKHHRLLAQWLQKLVATHFLTPDGTSFTATQKRADAETGATSESAPAWVAKLLDYLARCTAHHGRLFTGEANALDLLYDEQHRIMDVFYATNPVSQHLHDIARTVTTDLAETSDGPVSILEIGGGTGAATRTLLPAMAHRIARYVFTDISALFLSEARRAFGAHDFMAFERLDINAPLDERLAIEGGYDVIIAGNVLHDATHIGRTLRRMGRLLKPGGALVMIEATEPHSALQLATIGFLEGLNGYHDFRHQTHEAFLPMPRWRELLTQNGFNVPLTYPEEATSPLRQHLILATATRIHRPDFAAIEQGLRARHGADLPALTLRQRETLHFPRRKPSETEHGDRNELTRLPSDTLPSEVEETVIKIWREFLGRPISVESDFFDAGGDSLIATRVVARLARAGFEGVSLQRLFASPQLRAFCASLVPPATHRGHAPITLMRKEAKMHIFVFHASDGGVAAYLPLAQHLEATTYGLELASLEKIETLDGLAIRYAESILAAGIDGTLTLLGWSYGAFLAQSCARVLSRRGKSVDLILIEPVLAADFCATQREDLDAMMAARPDTLAGKFPISDAMLQQTLSLLKLLRGHEIDFEPPRRCLCIRAASRPQHWGDAAEDWSAYFQQAEYQTMPTDHWSLLLHEKWALEVAKRVDEWLGVAVS
ncbi:SDR family NAD(P)-dependent oxidoreductase [Candidatus Kirkpatrickella diaphorinae]|uniref:SDR family NAD(P)-dependent oxidoreductase n=1 Tax=Candidatus Kirkpatrickella diaphorinae TaxID=2984322 RepID=A0ABY6GLD2_9PROT|nr:SDR family NAD(P)-dependent oxidoreductase [Candidatus Kirkpatrickella diaphorinae]UYH51623.1 SDR family NAD(P)-dependent oxidoreductase [Candidatus Kirkpatrickella diaphorinae]